MINFSQKKSTILLKNILLNQMKSFFKSQSIVQDRAQEA